MQSSYDSPKTPGGISKILLTPCRRLGLSRKYNRKGPSPFISPLSRNENCNQITTPVQSKKRKASEDPLFSPNTDVNNSNEPDDNSDMSSLTHINITPSRNVPVSKKSSKGFLVTEDIDAENHTDISQNILTDQYVSQNDNKSVSKLIKVNSKSKKLKSIQTSEKSDILNETSLEDVTKSKDNGEETNVKNMPNNLNKECIVVIQKKMLKSIKNKKQLSSVDLKNTAGSQALFDSDSDDLPLCNLNNKDNKHSVTDIPVVKNKDTSALTPKSNKTKNLKQVKSSDKKSLQASDDDDDFECVKKKTILVKKTYDKVIKPSKAKSTGSITQKDIDEITCRIEMKKKLLIAKAMTEDTEELRNLIRKWQKGCQEALFELFDLMKKKFPDSRNMDYSEILQTLNIPPELVGYDVNNDCFITPDDSSIILSSINT